MFHVTLHDHVLRNSRRIMCSCKFVGGVCNKAILPPLVPSAECINSQESGLFLGSSSHDI